MKKYYTRFILSTYNCSPHDFGCSLFLNKELEDFYTKRYWVTQMMADQVWAIFEFDAINKRDEFLNKIFGTVPFYAQTNPSENLVFRFDCDVDKVDFMKYVNPKPGFCN